MFGYEASLWTQRVLQFGVIAAGVAVAGLVCAAIVGAVTGFVVRDQLLGVGWVAGAIGGALVGYPLGVIGGLVMLRRILHLCGSLFLGVVGGLLGAALAMLVVGQLNLASNPSLVYVIYFLSVPLLCVCGFLARGAAGKRSADGHDVVLR